MKKFLKDLFYGPGNTAADLGRIIGAVGVVMMLGGQVWNVMLGLPIDLGPGGLGGGLAAVIGGAAALVYAKDRAKSENIVAHAVADCPPETPPAKAKPKK